MARTAVWDGTSGTDLRFLLGPGVAVQIRSGAELRRSDIGGLIALVAVQRDVLARAAGDVPEEKPSARNGGRSDQGGPEADDEAERSD